MSRRAKGQNHQRFAATDLDGWDDLDDLANRTGLTVFERAMATEALDAATARAAWSSRPTSPPTPSSSPKAATKQEPPPRAAPPIARNTPPATVWDALRRLLACNKQELAARLGVSRHTLQRWERGEIPEAGAARVATLMQETLAAAGAGWTVVPVFRPEAPQK